MKKISIFLLGLLFMCGCINNPQSMAEKGVRNFLKKNIAAYEPISFGTLDTISVNNDSVYKVSMDSLNFYLRGLNETADQAKLAMNQQKAKDFKKKISDIETFYLDKKYKINHKYKGNTAEGSNQEIDKDFYLNNMFQVVE